MNSYITWTCCCVKLKLQYVDGYTLLLDAYSIGGFGCFGQIPDRDDPPASHQAHPTEGLQGSRQWWSSKSGHSESSRGKLQSSRKYPPSRDSTQVMPITDRHQREKGGGELHSSRMYTPLLPNTDRQVLKELAPCQDIPEDTSAE